jgi:hypothetical protein
MESNYINWPRRQVVESNQQKSSWNPVIQGATWSKNNSLRWSTWLKYRADLWELRSNTLTKQSDRNKMIERTEQQWSTESSSDHGIDGWYCSGSSPSTPIDIKSTPTNLGYERAIDFSPALCTDNKRERAGSEGESPPSDPHVVHRWSTAGWVAAVQPTRRPPLLAPPTWLLTRGEDRRWRVRGRVQGEGTRRAGATPDRGVRHAARGTWRKEGGGGPPPC